MNLEWILHPLFTYAVLAAGLAACSCLFLTVKAELRRSQTRIESERTAFIASVEHLRGDLEQLRAELRQADERAALLAQSPRSSINLSKRGQALRMYRRGEAGEAISAALDMTLPEVHLLLKVHNLGAGPPVTRSSGVA